MTLADIAEQYGERFLEKYQQAYYPVTRKHSMLSITAEPWQQAWHCLNAAAASEEATVRCPVVIEAAIVARIPTPANGWQGAFARRILHGDIYLARPTHTNCIF